MNPSQRPPVSGNDTGTEEYVEYDEGGDNGQGQGQGQGQGKSMTARSRRQSAGDRSEISDGELSLATSGQDSWAISTHRDYSHDDGGGGVNDGGSDVMSVGTDDDNRSLLSLASGFISLDQRQKQENRKRRKQQNDKKKQQQVFPYDIYHAIPLAKSLHATTTTTTTTTTSTTSTTSTTTYPLQSYHNIPHIISSYHTLSPIIILPYHIVPYQKYRDVSSLIPSNDKHERKHKQESYVDKVKNLFVGVQPASTVDGGVLTLTEKGRAFRFVHRWPLLMQVLLARKRKHECTTRTYTINMACLVDKCVALKYMFNEYIPPLLVSCSHAAGAVVAATTRSRYRQQLAHPPPRVRYILSYTPPPTPPLS